MTSPHIFDKRAFRFVPYQDCASISLDGPWLHQDGQAIALERSCGLRIRLRKVSCVYGLFVRHDWSGKIKVVTNGGETDCFDLYSAFRFQQCLPLFSSQTCRSADIRVSILGSNPLSRSAQIVFAGIFLRSEEADEAVDLRRPEAPPAPFITAAGDSFREIQMRMVDSYKTSLDDRGMALEEEAGRRWTKYAMRFREMLVYASPGTRMLDIGAGYLTAEFLKHLILPNSLDYRVQDIDPRVVEHDRVVFSACGIDPDHVREGVNTELLYADEFFDLVFSSHCLEHSSDILRTFSEIHRVLKPGGVLFFAVPFGYDQAEQHIYALDIDGWRALTAGHGFEVISQHVGNFYPESAHDLVVVARRL